MNTETKHTPGRMGRNIRPITKYPRLYCGRNTHVAQIVTDLGMPEAEAEANADRMVLCWNEYDNLCQQRDELAAALKDLLFNCVHGNGAAAWEDSKEKARAALSRVQS